MLGALFARHYAHLRRDIHHRDPRGLAVFCAKDLPLRLAYLQKVFPDEFILLGGWQGESLEIQAKFALYQ